jgi:hypothetical protein
MGFTIHLALQPIQVPYHPNSLCLNIFPLGETLQGDFICTDGCFSESELELLPVNTLPFWRACWQIQIRVVQRYRY